MPLKERIFLFLMLPYFITFLMGEETCLEEEYQIGTLCCPKCQPANRVFTHCMELSSTTCIPCANGTYMDHPNGLTECFICRVCDRGNMDLFRDCMKTLSTTCIPCKKGKYVGRPNGFTECFKCKVCDRGMGLIIKHTCTYSRNTVCGCVRGLFCTDPKGEDCDLCQRQTVCEPGYYMKKPGTETTDTVCETCPSGTFSAGNMTEKCKPWIRCSDQNMIEVKSGTPSSDSICEELMKRHNLVLLVLIFPLILIVVASSVLLYARMKKGHSSFPYCFSDCCLNENSQGGRDNIERYLIENKINENKVEPLLNPDASGNVVVNMNQTVNVSLSVKDVDCDSGVQCSVRSPEELDLNTPVEETGK